MRMWLQAGVVLLAVVAALVPVDSRVVERWYSTSVYPAGQRLLTPASNLVPFAWLDVLIAGALLLVLGIVWRAFRTARPKKRGRPWLVALGRLLTASAAAYLLFLAIWGLNYRRVPMAERLVLDSPAASHEAVMGLGRSAVDRLNALHQAAHAEGWRTAPWRDRALRESFEDVQRLLSDAAPAVPGRLKSSMLGPYFRWASVDGMVNPFALEVIGNPDLLPFERPFVAAHEWAHLAGYADESEASFVGWLTCVRAEPPAAYSGWLSLYWQIAADVSAADRKLLADSLDEGPRRDVAAITARLQRGQVAVVRDASWRVYDRYLKANRVEEGVRSYGAVVTLVVRARFEQGWTPVRRPSPSP
jgi:hypothetical protein